MEQLEKDLHLAKGLIESKIPYIPQYQFTRIYPFSNENLKDCLSLFDLKGKDCLTVLGSSDQVFDLFLSGAEEVTAFDINGLTKYYFALKKAALESQFSYQEYLEFFCYHNYISKGQNNLHPFRYDLFQKLAPFLRDESASFWKTLFEKYKPYEIRKEKGLFMDDECGATVLQHSIGYLEKENYEKLQDIAKEIQITFLNSDIKHLHLRLSKSYDFMYFSNIIQYVDQMYSCYNETTPLEKQILKLQKYRNMIEKNAKFLKADGTIMAGYLYILDDSSSSIAIFNSEARNAVFDKPSFSYLPFKSTTSIEIEQNYQQTSSFEDACLVYQKKK